MLTCPITTPYFHTRVLSKLSTHLPSSSSTSSIDLTRSVNASPIQIEPLSPLDTSLTPDEITGQLIGTTSSWIDLASPDPVIADVSRQVLRLELAYAAFCGITYVLIPGPRMRNRAHDGSGYVQFGREILDSLSLGPYMQLYIWLPLIDHSEDDVEEIGDLSPFARQQYLDYPDDSSRRLDLFGTWEAWNTIRSICKYSSRLSVGKDCVIDFGAPH
jgi:type II protein arginine methyltransferase